MIGSLRQPTGFVLSILLCLGCGGVGESIGNIGNDGGVLVPDGGASVADGSVDGSVGGSSGTGGASGSAGTGGSGGVSVAPCSDPAPAASTNERRCDELGLSCMCSEPLAATGQDFVGSQDPPDTTGKECGDGQNAWDSNSGARSVAIPNPPDGATASSVYQMKSHLGRIHHILGNDVTPGTKRMCVRQYQFLSADYPITCAPGTDCNCSRIKNQQFDVGRGYMMQAEWSNGARHRAAGAIRGTDGDLLIPPTPFKVKSGSTIHQEDVLGRWYRIETCVSGDLGQSNGSVRSLESRMTVPDTGQEQVLFLEGLPLSGVDTRIDKVWIGNNFSQGSCGSGKRHAAFAMQAEWETDDGQWIGPAAEMEGHTDCDADAAGP